MSDREPEPEWLSEIDSEDDSPSDPEQLWRLVDAGNHGAVAQVLRDLSERVAKIEDRDCPNPTSPAVVCRACGHHHPLDHGPKCEVCGWKVAP